MANYLIKHYKGKYRILCDVCEDTNDFPKKLNGTYEDIDCYISCENGVKIFSYGRGVLEVYVPSIQKGRNILRLYYRDCINKSNTVTNKSEYDIEKNDSTFHIVKETVSIIDDKLYNEQLKNDKIIFNLYETDEEVVFKFKAKDFDVLEKYLKPRTFGANISPFSVKNRPKTKYVIPDKDQIAYKEIIKKVPQEQLFLIGKYTKDFLKSLANKRNTWEQIKSDMTLKGLKNRNYIHSIGQWDKYIKYLEGQLCQN